MEARGDFPKDLAVLTGGHLILRWFFLARVREMPGAFLLFPNLSPRVRGSCETASFAISLSTLRLRSWRLAGEDVVEDDFTIRHCGQDPR